MALRCVIPGCERQQAYGRLCRPHRHDVTAPLAKNRRVGTPKTTCTDCGVPITGTGKTDRCKKHAPRGHVARATCVFCPRGARVIPMTTPRYQFVRVDGGGREGREGRHNIRKVISTVCEPCWVARSER